MIAVLAILKNLPWRYIGIALAVAAILFGAYRWAYGRGVHSRDAEVTQLTSRAVEAEASVKRLRVSIDQQNAAVAALKTEADKRAADGAVALEEVRKENTRRGATIAALRKSAEKDYADGAPCTVSDALRKVDGL